MKFMLKKAQAKALFSSKILKEVITLLRYTKKHFNSNYYDASCEFIAALFQLSYNELDNAVDGKEV